MSYNSSTFRSKSFNFCLNFVLICHFSIWIIRKSKWIFIFLRKEFVFTTTTTTTAYKERKNEQNIYIENKKGLSNQKRNKLWLIMYVFSTHWTWTIFNHPLSNTRRMVFMWTSKNTDFLSTSIIFVTNRTFRLRFTCRMSRRWKGNFRFYRLI